jgi:hypothetical protein
MLFVRRFIPPFILLLALGAAAPAGAKVKEIGVDESLPLTAAGCPKDCFVLDQVTGYQASIGKIKNPYTVKRKGRITAFTIALGKPNKTQTASFAQRYGTTPQARISILQVPKKGRDLKLTAQSEVINLAPYLGSTPTFALERSLPITQKSIVALTIPTWAPALAVKQPRTVNWRASRASGTCNDYSQLAAQQTLNSIRTFGCLYRTARVLYSATFVPDPKPTTPPADDGK